MENILFSFEIMAPIMLMIGIGFLSKLLNIMNDDAVNRVNKLIFWFCTPLLVFNNIYKAGISSLVKSDILIFCSAAIIAQFFISLAIVLLVEKDNAKRGVMLQGMFRSNYVIYGIQVVTAIAGNESASVAALLVSIVIPLFNILAVIALEMFNGAKPSVLKTIAGILRNPLILASAFAIILLLANVQIPYVIDRAIQDIAGITTPLAFIMLGAYFRFSDVRSYIKQISITTFCKLIVFPTIVIACAIFLGFRDGPLAIIMTVFATPIAISTFPMAQQMGGDAKLAAQLIVFTSILSIFTMFMWIFLLRQFAYF